MYLYFSLIHVMGKKLKGPLLEITYLVHVLVDALLGNTWVRMSVRHLFQSILKLHALVLSNAS